MTSIPGFHEFEFASDGMSHLVFQKGEGPGVILMHELPGMTNETIVFANRVVERGFTVFLPLLFGKPVQNPQFLGSMIKVCLSREFRLFAKRKSSPITIWLRALSRHALTLRPGNGVGAIGMCLTGSLVLAMMVDESVMAAVMSQPSLPPGITSAHKAALGTSLEDLKQAKARSEAGVTLLGLRFTGDPLCPRARFDTLEREFGAQFEPIEISSPDPAHDIPSNAHSILTFHYSSRAGHPTHEAYERVMAFLEERLKS